MELRRNAFKAGLREGRRQVGLWNQFGSATVTEIVADAGFDWVVIDTEHAPVELPVVIDQLRVLEHTGTSGIVRPAWNDAVLFKRLLDVGAQSLLVPYVQSPDEAARAVAATRYPPHGNRGVAATHRSNRYGRVADYYARAADEICVIVQLETQASIDALEAIGAVEGVDALFIGPSDLAASLGHLGDNRNPRVRATIEDVCRRAKAAGRPLGILAPVEADARDFFAMGFAFVAVGSDVGLLRMATDDLRQKFR